jgi:hypothetical protein
MIYNINKYNNYTILTNQIKKKKNAIFYKNWSMTGKWNDTVSNRLLWSEGYL